MERRTGQISGQDYMVIRDMELRVEPIEMQPRQWYTPIQEAWRQRRFMNRPRRDGRR